MSSPNPRGTILDLPENVRDFQVSVLDNLITPELIEFFNGLSARDAFNKIGNVSERAKASEERLLYELRRNNTIPKREIFEMEVETPEGNIPVSQYQGQYGVLIPYVPKDAILTSAPITQPEPIQTMFTYSYSSSFGTFETKAQNEPEAYSMFQNWLRQQETQITPEPVTQPEPEPVTQPEPEPEIKETWWVIRPSGIIEELTVSEKFVTTMTAKGWIFSKDKPTIEEPQNQNISVVFYIGKGGDLKHTLILIQ